MTPPRKKPVPPVRPKVEHKAARKSLVAPMPWQIAAFVEHFRQTFNARESAIRAGYKDGPGTDAMGSRLLAHAGVQEALTRVTLDTFSRTTLKTADILTALAEIAYLDPAECFAAIELGKTVRVELKDLHAMAPHVRRCISSFKVSKVPVAAGGFMDVIEVKFWNKVDALQLLAKHRGLLRDIVEHQVTISQLQKLSDEEFDQRDRESRERFERMMAARKGLKALPEASR